MLPLCLQTEKVCYNHYEITSILSLWWYKVCSNSHSSITTLYLQMGFNLFFYYFSNLLSDIRESHNTLFLSNKIKIIQILKCNWKPGLNRFHTAPTKPKDKIMQFEDNVQWSFSDKNTSYIPGVDLSSAHLSNPEQIYKESIPQQQLGNLMLNNRLFISKRFQFFFFSHAECQENVSDFKTSNHMFSLFPHNQWQCLFYLAYNKRLNIYFN